MLPRFRPDYHNSSSQRTITHLAQMQRRRKWSSSGSRQSRGKSGSAACYAESLWLSGADSLPSFPRLGWKAQPSSRAEGVSQGGSPRKGEEGVKKLKMANCRSFIFNGLEHAQSPVFEFSHTFFVMYATCWQLGQSPLSPRGPHCRMP